MDYILIFFIIMSLLAIGFILWLALLLYFTRKTLKLLMDVVLVALALVAIAGGLSVYAFFVAPNDLVVNHLQLNGTGVDMKIVFMSDFQRNGADPVFIQRAVDIANSENADLVLLGGDYVESSASELPSIAPLRTLNATYGVYGVFGNHDYGLAFAGRCPGSDNLRLNSDIRNFLEAEGTITLLGNENRKFGNVTLVALDDLWGCKRNESEALRGADPEAYRILLSHNQDGLAIGNSTANLYLFGHTHCGQVRLPFLGSVPKIFGFQGEYDSGHYLVNGSDVYTTCGLAYGPRFLAPPEITVIELN